MIVIISFFVAIYALYLALNPLIEYLCDPKGLRKYPEQNWLSGISNLAYGWEVGRKHAVFHTRRLHNALMKDPVIRVGPNWLSFGSSRAVNDIYGYNSRCEKAAIYSSLQGGGKHLVNIVDRTEHSHRRHMVAAAYAPKKIDMWAPDITDSTAMLLKRMDGMCTAPLSSGGSVAKEDLKFEGMLWSNLFTLETLVKIGLSKDMRLLEAGNDNYVLNDPDGTARTVSCYKSLHGGSMATSTLIWDTDWFPLLKKVTMALSPWYANNWQNGANWRAIVTQLVMERIDRYKNGEILDDLFQPTMEDKKTGTEPEISNQDRIAEADQMSISPDDVHFEKAELTTLIVNGGCDGPAISLANTLYYLVKNPQTLTRLREELDSALSPLDSVAPWSKVKNCAYLRACIDESMRLSPPVATDLARRTPPQGIEIDGQMVPGNTIVSISAYTAQRDPEVFPDPEAFTPERWLIRGSDRLKDMTAVYIPFSAGSRSCIGRNVTILMQMVFLATLCYRYDFALPSTEWEMDWEDYFNLWPRELPMKIWRREVKASA
ncbi:MAG: hypothetical protein Q9187_005598 [Circinaria calcarea]